MTLLGELAVQEPQLRVVDVDGRRALETVRGLTATAAIAKLRFGPGQTCEPVARLIETAVAKAEGAGVRPDQLVVIGGAVERAEDIVRVRRKAHGKADWISSPTSRVRVELRPAGLVASLPDRGLEEDAESEPPDVESAPVADSNDPRVEEIRSALFDVMDPDLGVNIVDLGFVRAIALEGNTAIITMTLTSPACPLSGVMEDQIRTRLLDEGRLVEDFRVDWVWVPAWKPSDITEEGRWELTTIGFSF
jgi:metal-sulfur cluster biosynthetic enzyme/ribosomal protein L22